MGKKSRKSALSQLIKGARAEQRAFWDGLSQAQRSATGTPDLDWSKQDTDLDALRDLPDFQAFYEGND